MLIIKEIKSNNECFNLEMLAIKAKDLIEIGIKKDKINKLLLASLIASLISQYGTVSYYGFYQNFLLFLCFVHSAKFGINLANFAIFRNFVPILKDLCY